MQPGADVLDLDELKGALPRRRNLGWVVGGTVRRVRTKDDSLSRWGGVTYVAGIVVIAITLTVIVRHDGGRLMVKTVLRKVCSIRVFTVFL